jgi:hypothetical protein
MKKNLFTAGLNGHTVFGFRFSGAGLVLPRLFERRQRGRVHAETAVGFFLSFVERGCDWLQLGQLHLWQLQVFDSRTYSLGAYPVARSIRCVRLVKAVGRDR